MATVTRGRKSTEERRSQVADLRDRLENWQQLTDAGLIAEYLARFDGYSARNAMLIGCNARRPPRYGDSRPG